MAALLVHWCSKLPWSMPKKCDYLRRESRLEFALSFAKRVPLELWCQPKGDLAIQYQKPPMQIQSAMYMYVYTVFAIVVYPGSTYTLMYTWSTNWHNESLCFKMLLGKEHCHSCTKTTYQKNNRATVTCKTRGKQKKQKTKQSKPKGKTHTNFHYESTPFVRYICPNYRPRFWFEDPTDSIEKPQRSTPTVPT